MIEDNGSIVKEQIAGGRRMEEGGLSSSEQEWKSAGITSLACDVMIERCGPLPWIPQMGVTVLEHKLLLSTASEVAQCLCLSPLPTFPGYHGYQS